MGAGVRRGGVHRRAAGVTGAAPRSGVPGAQSLGALRLRRPQRTCWRSGSPSRPSPFLTGHGFVATKPNNPSGEEANGTACHIQHSPNTPTTGLRERGNDTSKSTGRSGRQKAATRRNMRREERVTVQGPVKEQQPDGMSHRGGGGGEEVVGGHWPRGMGCALSRQSRMPLLSTHF